MFKQRTWAEVLQFFSRELSNLMIAVSALFEINNRETRALPMICALMDIFLIYWHVNKFIKKSEKHFCVLRSQS